MDHRTWRKSSYSGTQSNCVELAWEHRSPLIRDTKGDPDTILSLPRHAWHTFLTITTR